MKKWIGAICSGLAGVLSLVFLAMPAFTLDYGAFGKENYSGYKILSTKDFAEAETAIRWYRIFAWILIVLAVIMIVIAVLQILNNLKVVKMPAILDKVGMLGLVALAIVAVLTLLATFGIRWEFIDVAKDLGMKGEVLAKMKDRLVVGVSLWFVTIANILTAVCANVFCRKAK